MNRKPLRADQSENELKFELIKTLDEHEELTLKTLKIAEEIASAENLGLSNKVYDAQLKFMFMKQQEFYLTLRYMRVFNLLLQKNRYFMFNFRILYSKVKQTKTNSKMK